jgi:hypothetical protein
MLFEPLSGGCLWYGVAMLINGPWRMTSCHLSTGPGVQRTRLQEVLRPRSPLALQVHRQTIETYDALLDLQRYVRPYTYERAHRHAERAGLRGDRLAAAALASALGEARRAKLTGAPPSAPCPLPGADRSSPATLLAIARMWPSMSDTLRCPNRSSAVRQP